MPTVSAHVAITLAAHIDHVFGVMGNGNAYFLDALERETDVDFTAVRHEAGAVVAADALPPRVAAASPRPPPTYGAGLHEHPHRPRRGGAGARPARARRRRRADVRAAAPGTSTRSPSPRPSARAPTRSGRTDAAATTVIAIEHALTYRVPTVLAIPYDVAARRRRRPVPRAPDAPRCPAPLAAARPVRRAARRATSRARSPRAERPFLLAGRGAWLAGAGDGARRARRRHRRDDRARPRSGAASSPTTEFDLGVTGGFGAEGAMALVREADVAVVFGASLNQFTMRFGELFAPGHPGRPGRRRAGGDPPARRRVRPRRRGRRRAARSSTSSPRAARSRADGGSRSTSRALRAHEPGDGVAPDGRLDPRSVAARIGELLPEDRVVVSDGGHFIGWANMYWPVASPDRMIMVGTAFQSIGLGFPSVPGAALAKPESTIVLTTGDGGGLMALADLETRGARRGRPRASPSSGTTPPTAPRCTSTGCKGLADAPMRIPEVDFAGARHRRRRGGRRRARARRPRSRSPTGPRDPPPSARSCCWTAHLGHGRRAVPAGDHPRE